MRDLSFRPVLSGSVYLTADQMYSSQQAPYLVTGTNAGPIGGPAMSYPAAGVGYQEPSTLDPAIVVTSRGLSHP